MCYWCDNFKITLSSFEDIIDSIGGAVYATADKEAKIDKSLEIDSLLRFTRNTAFYWRSDLCR